MTTLHNLITLYSTIESYIVVLLLCLAAIHDKRQWCVPEWLCILLSGLIEVHAVLTNNKQIMIIVALLLIISALPIKLPFTGRADFIIIAHIISYYGTPYQSYMPLLSLLTTFLICLVISLVKHKKAPKATYAGHILIPMFPPYAISTVIQSLALSPLINTLYNHIINI